MLTSDFFAQNRRRFYQQLPPGGLVAIPANARMQRNTDAAHPFEQESNFWYLTGIDDPDWWLLADTDRGEEWLVAPHVPEIIRVFDGGLSQESAAKRSGITQVLEERAGHAQLQQLLKTKRRAYVLKPLARKVYGVVTNPAQQDLWRKVAGTAREDMRLILARQRAIKQPGELRVMQQAIDIAIDGVVTMLGEARSYEFEYQPEARLDYEFRRRGAKTGFDTVVAAGPNTCTVHHMADASPLRPDDWLLFDVGPQLNHYSADIARTVPLGAITPRQQAVYEALVRVHDHAASLLQPGQNVVDFLAATDSVMMHELASLGLMKPDDKKAYRRYFPHAIGHGLGLDPHDPLGRPEEFAENMVMTIEPGVYIPQEGIGMRLESVALLRKSRPRLMSDRLPTELAALQAML